jgi:hypothetical protein
VDAETPTTTNKLGTKSRSRNFVEWEDKSLSTSFVNTSKDPVAGAYQTGPTYWEHIHKKWFILHAAAPFSLKVYQKFELWINFMFDGRNTSTMTWLFS